MTPLRGRMLEDMSIRNFAENTQLSYVQQVVCFARYFGCSPGTGTRAGTPLPEPPRERQASRGEQCRHGHRGASVLVSRNAQARLVKRRHSDA